MPGLMFRDVADTDLNLHDCVLESMHFLELSVPPFGEKHASIRNVEFRNCWTDPGVCMIRKKVDLDRVLFEDFNCRGFLSIETTARFAEVVVVGKTPQELIITRTNVESEFSADREFELDVSRFYGDVRAIGLHRDLVRIDPERQVKVEARWFKEVPWQELGIPKSSGWRFLAGQVESFGVACGIYRLPLRTERVYQPMMNEKRQLEDAGLRFD